MERRSLFDPETVRSVEERIETLKPDTQPLWGGMTPAQMMAHCAEVQEVWLGKNLEGTPFLLRVVGPLFKRVLVSGPPQGPPREQDLTRALSRTSVEHGHQRQGANRRRFTKWTAMRVSERRTRSMLDRYNIIEERETAAALARVDAWLATQPRIRNVEEGQFGDSRAQADRKSLPVSGSWRKRVGIENTRASRTGADGVDGVDKSKTSEPRVVDGVDPADPEEGQ